ncbi:MAG: hypothetical protein WC994_06800 [Brumimicrobium sp.]
MKKIILFSVYGTLLLLVTNCAPSIGKIVTSQPIPSKTEAKENFTAEQLSQGKELWESNCDRCHKLYDETKHDSVGWNKTLKRMINRAKLSEEQGTLIRAYLIANSKES